MKKYVNGRYMDMTEEELTAAETAGKIAEAQERHRPYSAEEAFRLLLKEQLNSLTIDDQEALRMAEFYPPWEELVGKTAEQAGFKFSCDGKLYKTISPGHTFSSAWVPGAGTESLYTRIDAVHAGDLYDPIPYEGNMELNEGFCYRQNGTMYRCIRNTEQPVYSALEELVSIYVEAVGI